MSPRAEKSYALRNANGHTVRYFPNREDERNEDYDGPVVHIEVSPYRTLILVIEQAREHYATLVRQGYRKVA